MVLTALSKNFPGPDIKGRKEIDRAMADILKFLAFDQTGPQGQRRVQAFQGLDVGLFIQAEKPTAPGGANRGRESRPSSRQTRDRYVSKSNASGGV
jgi:hypothetical protein